MKLLFSSVPFGKAGSDDFKQVGDTQPNGTVQWGPTDANGRVPNNPQTVLSVQPDGAYQTRPLGSNGPFEVMKFTGSELIVRPNTGDFGGPTTGYVIAARTL